MPGRPRRSCDNCNAQKLRCNGEKPVCQRCNRHNRACIYTVTKRSGRGGSSLPPNGVAAAPVAVTVTEPLLSPPLSLRERRYYGIPSDLVPPLIDLFFNTIYNSNLLFHRPSLVAAIEAEIVRPDIVLSICALASKFYLDANGRSVLIDSRLGHEWAQAAGRLAFHEVETPSQDNIVVFLNLSLFWYSFGQFQRSGIHSACAGNTAWILGFPPNSSSNQSPLELEIWRRRFWACYLFCGFLAGSPFPKIPTDEMLNASLPCSEGEFALGKPHATISLMSGLSTQSVYGEMIRAMSLWSSVSAALKRSDASFATRLGDIQLLDRRVHEGRAKLFEYFPLSCENMAMVPRSDLQKVLLVHIIYHQCLCSLHSSIVPLFSWSACDDAFAYAQQLSAQTAYENANAVSLFLETALELEWDSRKMPSFIGYAAYCACAIQTPFVWCARPEVKQFAVRNIVANLKTLQILGSQWVFLDVLGKFAFALYKVHESQPFPLTDEPKGMSPESLKGFKPANSRARLSILGYNSIIVSDQGSLLKGTDEIGDLGLSGIEVPDLGLSGGDSLTDLIARISCQVRHMSAQFPIMTDPPFALEDSDLHPFQDESGMRSFTNDVPTTQGPWQCGYLEGWMADMTDLLHQDI